MILKGNQRGGGRQLALHLLNASDNEHVHVHELRGFTADDLEGAFHEACAVSRGTKCKQFLFSLSLNPPLDAKVSTEDFQAAVDAAEERLGLSGRPRAIVFHEKDGRRHAHAVWSRIDAEKMRAVNLPFYKTKLMGVSRELYIEHGWKMPRGFINSKERDPANYTLAQWQQAKRAGQDPKALKEMFQELWASSDSGKAFATALKMRGYTVARGDRRGYVAVDYRGEVYAIARYAGVKTKDVRGRLGDDTKLPSVEQAKAEHASRMTDMLKRHVEQAEARHKAQAASVAFRKAQIIQQQREERARIEKAQAARWSKESAERMQRVSKGLRGLWDRMTGKRAEVIRRNEAEAWQAMKRDRTEKDALIFRHIEQRQTLHRHVKQVRQEKAQQVEELHRDIAVFDKFKSREPLNVREDFQRAAEPHRQEPARHEWRTPDRGRDFEREQ